MLGLVNIKNNLNGVESASIGLSVLGTIAGMITQQVAYIATPLTLSLSLSLINRQRQLVTAEQRLANLEHQLVAIPAAPTTVEFYKLVASVNADRQELQRLEAIIIELEKRDNDLTPFLTEIDLTKDSLKQLSLNFSNLEQELNYHQDAGGNDRSLEEIGSNIQMLAKIDVLEREDFLETNLNSLELDYNSSVYISIEQIKLKLQFLEESSKVSEDAIKQIGWRFLELEQEFAARPEPLEIERIDRALTELDSNRQMLGAELSTTQAEQVLELANLELDRDKIYASIAEAKLKIQLLEDKSIAARFEDNPGELLQRLNDLDTSLGDLHDYSLNLNNRIENHLQHDRSELIDAIASDKHFQDLIAQQLAEQFEIFKQILPKNHTYELICGRKQSRTIFLQALKYTQERLILVCPWLTEFAVNQDVRNLIKAALDRGVAIEIGWGHLKDADNDRSQLSKEKLLASSDWAYNAVPWLYELQVEYPDLMKLKILGTHEKFLVCDRQFAMLGSHNYLTSDTKSREREVGIKTDSTEIIDKLIEIFDRAQA